MIFGWPFLTTGPGPNGFARHRLRTGAGAGRCRAVDRRASEPPPVTVFEARGQRLKHLWATGASRTAVLLGSLQVRPGHRRLSLAPLAPPGSWPDACWPAIQGARLDRRSAFEHQGQRCIQPDHQPPCCSWPQVLAFAKHHAAAAVANQTSENARRYRGVRRPQAHGTGFAIASEHVWDRSSRGLLRKPGRRQTKR